MERKISGSVYYSTVVQTSSSIISGLTHNTTRVGICTKAWDGTLYSRKHEKVNQKVKSGGIRTLPPPFPLQKRGTWPAVQSHAPRAPRAPRLFFLGFGGGKNLNNGYFFYGAKACFYFAPPFFKKTENCSALWVMLSKHGGKEGIRPLFGAKRDRLISHCATCSPAILQRYLIYWDQC